MTDFGKIAIGVRLTKQDAGFFCSYVRLLQAGTRTGDVMLSPAVHLPHAVACNFLLAQFLKTECDSLLFVDDDMRFPDNALDILRTTEGAYDMVAGLATARRGSCESLVFRHGADGKFQTVPLPVPVAGVVAVDVLGLGFTLVKRDMLQKIVTMLGSEEIFSFDPMLGEDGNFSQQVELAGGTMAVNCDLILEHAIQAYATIEQSTGKVIISVADFGLRKKQTTEEEK